MKTLISLLIALFIFGCSAPETVVEKWHIYEVPMSECEIHSEVPCTATSLPESFDSESEARKFAKAKYEERDNVLWLTPKKEEEPETIYEYVDKEVPNYINSDDKIQGLKNELAQQNGIFNNVMSDYQTMFDCRLPGTDDYIKGGRTILLYNDSCESQKRVCDRSVWKYPDLVQVPENDEYVHRSCPSGRTASKINKKDYSVCRDVTKDQYFPTSKPYLSKHVNEWFQASQINSSYPFAECREACRMSSDLIPNDEEACKICELKQQPSHCFAKRNFYQPHNSKVPIKIDEL